MWTRISADELQHCEILRDEKVIRPRASGVRLIEIGITEALKRLGVDITRGVEPIRVQMDILDISVHDLDAGQMLVLANLYNYRPSDDALGFYVYKAMKPQFFISDPHVNPDGLVAVWLYPIEGPGNAINIVGGKLPV